MTRLTAREFNPAKEHPEAFHRAAAETAGRQARAKAAEAGKAVEDPAAVPEASPPTVLELLDARRVILAQPPPEPAAIYSLAGQRISTSGNLTVLSGQSKTGKSAVVAAMVAAPFALPDSDLLGFAAAPAHGRAVILLDTEQSPYDAWRLQRRAMARAGLHAQPRNLRHFYVLDLTPAQRREALERECERAAHECGGIHSITVDGMADLIDDPNDIPSSFGLVTMFVGLAVRFACPLVTVLHENPALPGQAGKTRGHLGSQCERKAETNLRMMKDGDGVTTVFTERSRSAHIPQSEGVRFMWDDSLQRHVSTGSAAEAKAEAMRAQQAVEVNQLFNGGDAVGGLSHKDIVERVCDVFSWRKTAAESRVRKWTAAGLIRKNSGGFYVRTHR